MIAFTQNHGTYYEDETTGKRYELLELKELHGGKTSDIIAILGDRGEGIINHFYGAQDLKNNPRALDGLVAQYIEEYRKTIKPAPVPYRFAPDGVKAFENDALSDIFAELDKGGQGHAENFDFVVTCGNRSIRIPCGAEEYEALCRFLNDAWEEGGDE